MDESSYYTDRTADLLQEFDADARRWRAVLTGQYGSGFALAVLQESRGRFAALIPQIPYIGGDESWTASLVESVRCLAFYQAMVAHGRAAADAGRILFDAVLARAAEPQAPVAPSRALTPQQMMVRRRRRAERSEQRLYPEDYVCAFVPGGEDFDYGYDFTECAAQKFYHALGADEFLPFFCYLDFAYSKVYAGGFTRTMTLAEGDSRCDHRFKAGRVTEVSWPPPFLRGGMEVCENADAAWLTVAPASEGEGRGETAMANTFDWIEIHTTDITRSARFYFELFGWKLLERDRADDLEVLIFDTGAAPRGENLRLGGIWQRPAGERLGIVVYVVVDSLDSTVVRAVELGGKVMTPRTPQGSSFRACIADPDGNVLGIWEEGRNAQEAA